MQQPELPPDNPATSMEKVFCDPVHGHIVLDPLLVKIIDTPQFQRLRNIKQLGGKYFVYPGASHNRFEHSLGVAHLAGRLVETLKAQQPELGIDDRDVLCVKVAGLCHDLGHGPFSHVWDGCALPKMLGNDDWEHEEGSASMLDYLIKKSPAIETEYDKLNLDGADFDKDIKFIKELITVDKKFTSVGAGGETVWGKKYEGREEKKRFLYEIISNKRNGIDVDKWDYFKRDCHHLGITCIFDIDRALKFVRVIKVNEQLQICFRDKEARNIYQMFQTRELLHRMAYQHKTAKAVEMMLTEALYLADKSGEIKIPGTEGEEAVKLSECHEDRYLYAYTNLTDHVFQLILTSTSTNDDIKKSKDLLQRIQKRDIYRFVGEVPDHHAGKLKEWLKDYNSRNDQGAGLVHDEVTFHFGMKKENPFDKICFFKKDKPNEAKPTSLEEISSLLPKKFQETVWRVYTTTPTPDAQKARKDFDEWKEGLGSQQPASECEGTPSQNGSNRSRVSLNGSNGTCRRKLIDVAESSAEDKEGEPVAKKAKPEAE